MPDNPGAWLMATAKHRAIDHLRRRQMLERKHEELGRELEAQQDERAPPISTPRSTTTSATTCCGSSSSSCHPVLSTEARVALTLRLLGGLTTDEIARAFLVAGADDRPAHRARQADARRRRASRSRSRAAPSSRRGCRRCSRSSTSIFNEGYSATAGDDWMRPALCEDALRLGRILAELAPDEPEVHGLVALMEIQASRSRGARRAGGRARPAARPEPRALGSAAHPPRPRGARARRGARRRARARTRCRPRSPRATRGRARRRRRTGRASRALYDALAAAHAVAGRRAQPRRRASRWRSARRRGSSSSTRSPSEPVARGLPPAAERARRPARSSSAALDEARVGVRARGVAHAQRARASPAARTAQTRAGGRTNEPRRPQRSRRRSGLCVLGVLCGSEFHQVLVSFRYLIRCGWSAAAPRRRLRSAS